MNCQKQKKTQLILLNVFFTEYQYISAQVKNGFFKPKKKKKVKNIHADGILKI